MLMNQPERGVIGIGEPPTISTAAAIANAVANAIGVRVQSLPLTPDKVLAALAAQREGRRDAVKAFAYVNAANQKEALAALATERGKVLPLAGGMDLLGLMKDYIAQPDALVNVKHLPSDIAVPAQGLIDDRRGRASSWTSPGTPRSAKAYPALACCRRSVGTPQIRNAGDRRRQPDAAAALLVLPERRVRLPEEGRRRAASPWTARTSSTRSSATARATSSIRRTPGAAAHRLRRAHSAWSGPQGEREIDGRQVLRDAGSQHVSARPCSSRTSS